MFYYCWKKLTSQYQDATKRFVLALTKVQSLNNFRSSESSWNILRNEKLVIGLGLFIINWSHILDINVKSVNLILILDKYSQFLFLLLRSYYTVTDEALLAESVQYGQSYFYVYGCP